jgi:hypothetical protein
MTQKLSLIMPIKAGIARQQPKHNWGQSDTQAPRSRKKRNVRPPFCIRLSITDKDVNVDARMKLTYWHSIIKSVVT